VTPEIRELYQKLILEHHARPHHQGPLPDCTHEALASNPLCGDRVTLRLRLEGDRIAAARFEGDGCALSRASASLLTLAVTGRTPAEAEALATQLDRLVARGPENASADRALLGDLVALEGVRDVPARRRCVTLPWEALRAALGRY
jgi:nitrogen fixation NifU-like protein